MGYMRSLEILNALYSAVKRDVIHEFKDITIGFGGDWGREDYMKVSGFVSEAGDVCNIVARGSDPGPYQNSVGHAVIYSNWDRQETMKKLGEGKVPMPLRKIIHPWGEVQAERPEYGERIWYKTMSMDTHELAPKEYGVKRGMYKGELKDFLLGKIGADLMPTMQRAA